MKSLAKKVQRFLISEDGSTTVHCAVLLGVIVIVCLMAVSSMDTNPGATSTNVATELGNAK